MNPFPLIFLTAALPVAAVAAPVDQWRSQAAEIIARDRKGEPAEVILEKTVTGKKTPAPQSAASITPSPATTTRPSRLELWRRQRQAREHQAAAAAAASAPDGLTSSASKKSP